MTLRAAGCALIVLLTGAPVRAEFTPPYAAGGPSPYAQPPIRFVSADGTPLTFHLQDAHRAVSACAAPCERSLPSGTTWVSLSRGGAELTPREHLFVGFAPPRMSGAFVLAGDTVVGRIDSRSTTRTLGWVGLPTSMVASALLFFAASRVDGRPCDAGSRASSDTNCAGGQVLGLGLLGFGVLLGGIYASTVAIWTPDRTSLVVRPGPVLQ